MSSSPFEQLEWLMAHVPECHARMFAGCATCDCVFASSPTSPVQLDVKIALTQAQRCTIRLLAKSCARCAETRLSAFFLDSLTSHNTEEEEDLYDGILDTALKFLEYAKLVERATGEPDLVLLPLVKLMSILHRVEQVTGTGMAPDESFAQKVDGSCLTCFAALLVERLCLASVPSNKRDQAKQLLWFGMLQRLWVNPELQCRLTYVELAKVLAGMGFVLLVLPPNASSSSHAWVNVDNVMVLVHPHSRTMEMGWTDHNPVEDWTSKRVTATRSLSADNLVFTWSHQVLVVPRTATDKQSKFQIDTAGHERIQTEFARNQPQPQSLPQPPPPVASAIKPRPPPPSKLQEDGFIAVNRKPKKPVEDDPPSFRHSENEANKEPYHRYHPHQEGDTKWKFCKAYMDHRDCPRSRKECQDAHGMDDLREDVKRRYRTVMCDNAPNCRHGRSCMFAHSRDELRKI